MIDYTGIYNIFKYITIYAMSFSLKKNLTLVAFYQTCFSDFHLSIPFLMFFNIIVYIVYTVISDHLVIRCIIPI